MTYFVNALYNGYTHREELGQPRTLTYSFATEPRYDFQTDFQVYSAEQKAAVREALSRYSGIANIKFVELSSDESDFANLTFFRDEIPGSPNGSNTGYEIDIPTRYTDLSPNSPHFEVLLHEMGHVLGLKHPGNYGGFEDFPPYLPSSENNRNNTIMSYTFVNGPAALKIFDYAAIHYIYGVNPSARASNDTYHIADRYIWDGAGIDTLSASEQTLAVYLDLRAGSWIYAGTKNASILAPNQAFVGYGTLIENATGGSGHDIITGNSVNNTFNGGAGNDSLNGGDGNDGLNGGLGNDVLNGGNGTDWGQYWSATGGVTVNLNLTNPQNTLGAGIDTLIAIENLNGTGFNDTLAGNSLSNTLLGNAGNDTLAGGAGNDVLSGGTGKDIFIFNTALSNNIDKVNGFIPVDDTIKLENAIFTKLANLGVINSAYFKVGTAATDNNDYVVYNNATGVLSYDADGNGAGLAVKIAVLGVHLALTAADFIVI